MYKHGEWLFKTVFETRWCYLYLLITVPICIYIGMLTSTALSLPALAIVPLLAPFIYDVCFSEFRRGVFHLSFWAIVALLFVTFMISQDYVYRENIINGRYFSNDQMKWLKYNEGYSGTFSSIFTNYFNSYFFVAAASLVSGGVISLFIIAVELNNFAYTLSELLPVSHNSIGTVLSTLYIWEVINFVSYFCITLAFAGFFLKFILDFEFEKKIILKYVILSILILLVSISVRYGFSNHWRSLILKTVDKNDIIVLNMPDDIKTSTSFQFYRR